MKDRNICAEAGCSAACCRNMMLKGVSETELNNTFPDAKKVAKEKLGIGAVLMGGGVYYTDTGYMEKKPYEVQIVGQCPNLSENNECLVYDSRPSVCRNFVVGSPSCTKSRISLSLSPVPLDLVKEAQKINQAEELIEVMNGLKKGDRVCNE